MDLFIDTASGQGLSEQLYRQIRDAILAGRLQPGDQLLPSRLVAGQLQVSRYTVTAAYGRLAAEGFISGRAGGGSVVTGSPGPAPGPVQGPPVIMPARRFVGWSDDGGPLAPAPSRFDLRAGRPDVGLFPADTWRKKVNAAMRDADGLAVTGAAAGEARLRRAIARWIGRSRAVVAEEDTIIVTSGAQHGIDLVARVLLEPGDVVAVEDPGYRPVVSLLRCTGAQVVGVPVDEQGLVVSQLPAAARMVYLTPSHQYPLGVVMSMARRRELLAWAGRHGAAVIEDDYDSEFRYTDRPLEPIQRLDGGGRVIYLGSFSKTLSPALRLGFAVVPPSLAGPVAALRQLIDWHPPAATQYALAAFLEDGTFGRQLRRAGRVYRRRHQLLQAALAGPLSPWLSAVPSQAGLHMTAWLGKDRDEDQIRSAAAARGIATTGLRQYYHAQPAQPGLVIGFGAIATDQLPAALDALGGALSE